MFCEQFPKLASKLSLGVVFYEVGLGWCDSGVGARLAKSVPETDKRWLIIAQEGGRGARLGKFQMWP